MRLIHTAWQIGNVFRFVGEAAMSLQRGTRLDASGPIGIRPRLAEARPAPARGAA